MHFRNGGHGSTDEREGSSNGRGLSGHLGTARAGQESSETVHRKMVQGIIRSSIRKSRDDGHLLFR